ncbi:unnamed protein product, partial [Rotaria sp. Silwood2]
MDEDYIIGAFLHPNYKQLIGASSTQIADCYTTCRLLTMAATKALNEYRMDESAVSVTLAT